MLPSIIILLLRLLLRNRVWLRAGSTLRRRTTWFPTPLIIAAAVGLVAHTAYLLRSAIGSNSLPISTADWLLWAAWLLAIVYLTAYFYLPRLPPGSSCSRSFSASSSAHTGLAPNHSLPNDRSICSACCMEFC